MASTSLKPINGTIPISGLTKFEYRRLIKVETIVNQILKFSPSTTQQLSVYSFPSLFELKSATDQAQHKTIQHALHHLKAMESPRENSHIQLICYKWLTFLQNNVYNSLAEEKLEIITELEQHKKKLTTMPPSGYKPILKPDKKKTFKLTKDLQALAGLYKKTPSLCNQCVLWASLQPVLKKKFTLRLESKSKHLGDFQREQKEFSFFVMYEVLYFTRDMMIDTPEFVQEQACAATHLIKCFHDLTQNLSEEKLNAFVNAWWVFAILEVDYPPLTAKISKTYPSLKLDAPEQLSPPTLETYAKELGLIALEVDDYLLGRCQFTLDAHMRCVTSFFQLCLKYLEMRHPDIQLTNTPIQDTLIISYFFCYNSSKNITQDSVFSSLAKVSSTQMKTFAAYLEKSILQMQTVPINSLQEILDQSILEYLQAFFHAVDALEDFNHKDLSEKYKTLVSNALQSMHQSRLAKLNPNDNKALSQVLRATFELVEIESDDPFVSKMGEVFTKDITPFLARTGPYANMDKCIADDAQKEVAKIHSKAAHTITREDLRSLALLWIEGTRVCILRSQFQPKEGLSYQIMKQLHLQKRICMPEISENNIPSALIEGCPYVLLFSQVTNDDHHIPTDTPFLILIEKALLQLFGNKPFTTTHPWVVDLTKQFPFNFAGAAKEFKEDLVPMIKKLKETLEELKHKPLNANDESEIYQLLGALNEQWLFNLRAKIQSLPEDNETLAAYKKANEIADDVDLEILSSAKVGALQHLNSLISIHQNFCRTTVFSKIDPPEDTFKDKDLLKQFVKRVEKDPKPYLKYLIPKLKDLCDSLLGKTRLVTFLPQMQATCSACTNFNADLFLQAYERLYTKDHNEAAYLIDSFEKLIAILAQNEALGDAPRHFLEAYQRFAMATHKSIIPNLLRLEMPISKAPDIDFFEDCIKLCPEADLQTHAHFNAKEMLEASQNDVPEDIELHRKAFIQSVHKLFQAGSDDKKALLTMQLEWFNLAPIWITKSMDPSQASIRIVKKLKEARKRLRAQIKELESPPETKSSD